MITVKKKWFAQEVPMLDVPKCPDVEVLMDEDSFKPEHTEELLKSDPPKRPAGWPFDGEKDKPKVPPPIPKANRDWMFPLAMGQAMGCLENRETVKSLTGKGVSPKQIEELKRALWEVAKGFYR